MHTVAETPAFRQQAEAAGMSNEEIDGLTFYLSDNPTAGAVVPGTGGCRKLRVARKGKGKQGGYRTITFYSGTNLPVFMIALFAKGERADLTQKERNALASFTKQLVAEYRGRIVRARA